MADINIPNYCASIIRGPSGSLVVCAPWRFKGDAGVIASIVQRPVIEWWRIVWWSSAEWLRHGAKNVRLPIIHELYISHPLDCLKPVQVIWCIVRLQRYGRRGGLREVRLRFWWRITILDAKIDGLLTPTCTFENRVNALTFSLC